MAKTDSTRGKGAKDGEAKRATPGATPAGSTAKKAATRTATKSAAGGASEGGTTGAAAGKAASKRAAGAGAGGAGAGGATAKTARKTRGAGTARGGRGGGLQAELRDFVSARPQGWGHQDWLGLLDDLRGKGHDVSDAAAVGMALERERLAATLEGVEGVNARQVRALTDRFQTLWSLRQASADEIADTPGISRPLGERIRQALG
ncbi:MAG TPA: hypothetical protein VHG28_11160 [Longimicrobiaceae bacterium]|nr:hypothetical protein [Longimicrobiaceae bacterium]